VLGATLLEDAVGPPLLTPRRGRLAALGSALPEPPGLTLGEAGRVTVGASLRAASALGAAVDLAAPLRATGDADVVADQRAPAERSVQAGAALVAGLGLVFAAARGEQQEQAEQAAEQLGTHVECVYALHLRAP